MTKRGRPPIPESAMLAVWSLVQTEMHMGGHSNVSKACRAVLKRFDGAIKFKNRALPEPQQLWDVIKSEQRLRKRYYDAERDRKDATTYPLLHLRALMLLQDLPPIATRYRAQGEVYEAMRKDGHHPDGSTIPKGERAALAFHGKYPAKQPSKTSTRKSKTARKPA